MRNRLFNAVGKASLQVLHCSNSTLEGAKCQRGPWIDMNLISEITLMAVVQNSCSANAFSWSGTSGLSSISPDSPRWLGKMGSPLPSSGRKINKSHESDPGKGSTAQLN